MVSLFMNDWGPLIKPATQTIKRGVPQSEIMDARQAAEELLSLDIGTSARIHRRMLFELYPDDGPLRRELYKKHLEFFEASKLYSEIGAIAANRVGKTTMAGYACACHSTGWYPKWWPGRKFKGATRGWACGKSGKKTREIVQTILFGETAGHGANKGVTGTGMIPLEWIGRITWQQGTADYIDTARIRNIKGGWSMISLKSYEQGRDAMEGDKLDWCWDDEEPPEAVYGEQIMRLTPTTGRGGEMGLMMGTFTPLEGLTEVVLSFWDPQHQKNN